MCGISGFIDTSNRRSAEENGRILKAMSDVIAHRGPDGDGFWNDQRREVWLAHRRLAIIDLSNAAAQPMAAADGRGVLTYNGEVYNYRDLQPALEAAGYRARGHGDTEVLVHAIAHHGVERAASLINGIFAFAWWNAERRTLSLVRDRLGKKPIYWARTPHGIIFGSELRAMLAHPDCPSGVDPGAVADLLRLAYIPSPRSILKDVHKVDPGTIVIFHADSGEVESKPYWSVTGAIARAGTLPVISEPAAALAAVGDLLSDAVDIRRMSDVPLGAFLSGGIDSSLVVAMMQRHATRPVKTFSIGYSSSEYDESADAARVAAHLGTDHHEMIVSPQQAMSVIPNLADLYDEPFADMSQVPTFLVSEFARREVTVAVSGDGGDEVFAGYNRHVAAQGVLRKLAMIPAPFRRQLASAMTMLPPERWQALFDLLPARSRPRLAGEKMHKLAHSLGLPFDQQYRSLISQWQDPQMAVIGDAGESAADRGFAELHHDAVARMRALDLRGYLPHDILTKVDRASMAVSLEARSPLLDYRLVELSFRIPSTVHIQRGKGKWLLRELLARDLPREMFERPKMGFGIPISDWLRGDLRTWAEDLLSIETFRQFGLVKAEPVRTLWQRHLNGEINGQYLLWPVLMLNAWCRRFETRVSFGDERHSERTISPSST